MTTMKSYDPEARCPKCGGGKIGTYYCSGEYGQRRWNEVFHSGEAIHRTCQTCQYEWVEAVLQSVQDESQERKDTV